MRNGRHQRATYPSERRGPDRRPTRDRRSAGDGPRGNGRFAQTGACAEARGTVDRVEPGDPLAVMDVHAHGEAGRVVERPEVEVDLVRRAVVLVGQGTAAAA